LVALVGLEETFGDVVKERVAKREGRELYDNDVSSSVSSDAKAKTTDKNKDLEIATSSEGVRDSLVQSEPEKATMCESRSLSAAQGPSTGKRSLRNHLLISFTRPLALLFGNYVCFALSLYAAT
jgi:hypothetical protein